MGAPLAHQKETGQSTSSRVTGAYKNIAKYQFITAEMIAEDLQRDQSTTRKRCLALYEANYLNRVQRICSHPMCISLVRKARRRRSPADNIPEFRFIKSKSKLLIDHDLEITSFTANWKRRFTTPGTS